MRRPLAIRRRRRPGRPPPGMETTLTAMLFSGGRAALDSRSRSAPQRSASEDQAIGNLVATSAARASHGTWTAGRPSGRYGLRDLRAGGRYLLCSGGLSPVVDDRPHQNVLILRAASADAPASWPP